jgi:hypothetical protein
VVSSVPQPALQPIHIAHNTTRRRLPFITLAKQLLERVVLVKRLDSAGTYQAASLLYEDRIVIFKEKGLHFPTNYDSIGAIEFEEDGSKPRRQTC